MNSFDCYGTGAKWCIGTKDDDSHWESYTRIHDGSGDYYAESAFIFIYIKKTKSKYMLQIRDFCYNEDDCHEEFVSEEEFKEYLSHHIPFEEEEDFSGYEDERDDLIRDAVETSTVFILWNAEDDKELPTIFIKSINKKLGVDLTPFIEYPEKITKAIEEYKPKAEEFKNEKYRDIREEFKLFDKYFVIKENTIDFKPIASDYFFDSIPNFNKVLNWMKSFEPVIKDVEQRGGNVIIEISEKGTNLKFNKIDYICIKNHSDGSNLLNIYIGLIEERPFCAFKITAKNIVIMNGAAGWRRYGGADLNGNIIFEKIIVDNLSLYDLRNLIYNKSNKKHAIILNNIFHPTKEGKIYLELKHALNMAGFNNVSKTNTRLVESLRSFREIYYDSII